MAGDQDTVGNLEQEALRRKERLKALKQKQSERTESKEEESSQSETRDVLPRPKFRSYNPQDEALKENKLPDAKPGDVEAEVEEQLGSAQAKVVVEELDLANLAPRKPDWDLKRDVAKKLERLERRTQKAIAELIRERLKKGQEDMVTSVNAGATANQIPDD